MDYHGVCEPIDLCVVTRAQTKSFSLNWRRVCWEIKRTSPTGHNPSEFYETELNLEDLFEENHFGPVVDSHVDQSCEMAQHCVHDGVFDESVTESSHSLSCFP